MITQIGTLNNGRSRSAVFDGLYGVQLWRSSPQSAQISEDEAPRTTALSQDAGKSGCRWVGIGWPKS